MSFQYLILSLPWDLYVFKGADLALLPHQSIISFLRLIFISLSTFFLSLCVCMPVLTHHMCSCAHRDQKTELNS